MDKNLYGVDLTFVPSDPNNIETPPYYQATVSTFPVQYAVSTSFSNCTLLLSGATLVIVADLNIASVSLATGAPAQLWARNIEGEADSATMAGNRYVMNYQPSSGVAERIDRRH